jgi:hypothetical protein
MAAHMMIDLECGLSVDLDSMLILDTYASLLESSPNDLINEKIMRSHLETIQKIWGAVPVHVMEPALFTNERQQREFFPVLMAANLWSGTPVKDSAMHGSHLVLIQFHKEFSLTLISDFVNRVKTVSWREYANDFQW